MTLLRTDVGVCAQEGRTTGLGCYLFGVISYAFIARMFVKCPKLVRGMFDKHVINF